MAVNIPDVQILVDTGKKTVVKVTAYYNAANNSNSTIVNANTLFGANNSAPTVLSITEVNYSLGLANGYAMLYWVNGAVANVNAVAAIMGDDAAGTLLGYMKNPLASNTANLNANSGDLGLQVQGAGNQDSLTMIITMNKEVGYANADVGY